MVAVTFAGVAIVHPDVIASSPVNSSIFSPKCYHIPIAYLIPSYCIFINYK